MVVAAHPGVGEETRQESHSSYPILLGKFQINETLTQKHTSRDSEEEHPMLSLVYTHTHIHLRTCTCMYIFIYLLTHASHACTSTHRHTLKYTHKREK